MTGALQTGQPRRVFFGAGGAVVALEEDDGDEVEVVELAAFPEPSPAGGGPSRPVTLHAGQRQS